jgi:lysyl-tRNA synthetase class 2
VSAAWRPVASIATLRRRAHMLGAARAFFAARGILEVETPVLSAAGTTDPQIESVSAAVRGAPDRRYLGTSPEFAMKRLLAAGSGDIYQICKVFRDGEVGRWHNPEFTLVEWYRVGFDDAALMDETAALVTTLLAPARRLAPPTRLTYAEALRIHAGVDAWGADEAELARAAVRLGVACDAALDRDARLDLLMGLVVGPRLGRGDSPTFICDYPPSQASLARLRPGPPAVAARFELYLDGVELANGFHELTSATEQRARFEADNRLRRSRGQPEVPMDERLLEALQAGLPDSAGVALGFDRVVALATGAAALGEVMAFPFGNA